MTPDKALTDISGIAELTHLGVIRAQGDDVVTFLQGQLTQDVAQLGLDQARLAAFCNAKGRMQASFIVFKRGPNEILLICSADILVATLKRLSMFVMRAKAKLDDASGEFALYGIAGDAIKEIAEDAYPAGSKVDFDHANLLFLHPVAGVARAIWCGPAASPPLKLPAIDPAVWHWLDVRSGVAMVTRPIVEAFVPQMLNYESVGGVSFKKGCYPGQEVVARSQFRGTLKRRAYLVHSDAAPAVGQEIFLNTGDDGQPCGLVAAAAAHPSGGFDAIISMQTSAAADAAADPAKARLTLGSVIGAALLLLPLPYPLLEDI